MTMTNGMIFKRALMKAFNNRWKHFGMSAAIEKGSPLEYTDTDWENLVLKPQGYYSIIFSKDFARAFWGEQEVAYQISPVRLLDAINKPVRKVKAYEAHLSEMVLEEDPLKYLEKFL